MIKIKPIKTNNMELFITDYASYNEGTQFEFGKWWSLDDYADAEDFKDAVQEYFEKADEKRPLDEYGSKREELMITDSEGIGDLYQESYSDKHIEELYTLLEMADKTQYDIDFLIEVKSHFGYDIDDFEMAFDDMIIVHEDSAYDIMIQSCTELENLPSYVAIDWEKTEEWFYQDYAEIGGYYVLNR